jgi:hypothetical protein
MTDLQKRLEIVLGACREPIPARFYRTFEDKQFDMCVYCHAPLLAIDTQYTIAKFYSRGELKEEIAVCRNCQSQMKEGYSAESLNTLKSIYSEAYVRQRLDILFQAEAGEDRVARMLAECSICSTPKDEVAASFEYALCQGNELVLYTHPSMVCDKCTLRIYDSLSEQTRDHKRRFMEEHFGFPPSGSKVRESDVESLHLLL